MTQEEIIRMAREAGLIRQRGNLDIVKHSITQMERFAALIAAHEREACAKECDKVALRFFKACDDLEQFGADECAAVIRARSDK